MRWIFLITLLLNAVAFYWWGQNGSVTAASWFGAAPVTGAASENSESVSNAVPILLAEEVSQTQLTVTTNAKQLSGGKAGESWVGHESIDEPDHVIIIDEPVAIGQDTQNTAVNNEDNKTDSDINDVSTNVNGSALNSSARCATMTTQGKKVGVEIKSALKQHGVLFESTDSTTEEIKGYWLIVRPYSSRQQADNALNKMREKSVSSFVVESGKYKNGLSLGVFAKKNRTERYQKELSALGFETVIIPRYRKVLKTVFKLPALSGDKREKLMDMITGITKKYEHQALPEPLRDCAQ